MQLVTHVRVKEEVLVSKERVEQFEDSHQLCRTELHPTTQLQMNIISCTCIWMYWHTHCLQQVLN